MGPGGREVIVRERPLIVVGAPVFGMVGPEVLEDWMRWMYYCGRRLPQYDFELGIVPKKEQFRARNLIIDEARKIQADYVLMIDDDMIVNPWQTTGVSEAYGFIDTLVKHGKDVCGILYYQRMGGCHPVLMKGNDGETGYRYLRDDEITRQLQDVDVAGGGCLLINMRVFNKLPMPFFQPENEFGTDIQLCRSARAHGYSVAADTSIEFGHLRDERTIITGRNRAQFALSDHIPGEIKQAFDSEKVYADLLADACEYTGYRDLDEMTANANIFMQRRNASGLPDAAWYRQYPRERIARQVWFNTLGPDKRRMTEYILSGLDHRQSLQILDFGCGIGIPSFFLLERGHRVTSLDVAGTGTQAFLAWRLRKHGLPTDGVVGSVTELPELGDRQFDVIIAMDAIEHVSRWRELVPLFAAHLRPGGVLFANNAILEDTTHPEHYDCLPKPFLEACLAAGLYPANQITYEKREPASGARRPAMQEMAHA